MAIAVNYFAVEGLPMIAPFDDLGAIIEATLQAQTLPLKDGDIVCVAQKIISKAEGRLVTLAEVTPSEQANSLAELTLKDPRLVQLILDEASEVVRHKPGVLIVRHRLGFVCAQAGIDQSNVERGDEQALLLPVDPDASAHALMMDLQQRCGVELGVIITDSHNRPWRMGTVGTAIGCAGCEVLEDHRGGEDIFGRELKVTLINRADAIAGAATLLMGETTEKIPLVIARGFTRPTDESLLNQTASMINRPVEEDMFR